MSSNDKSLEHSHYLLKALIFGVEKPTRANLLEHLEINGRDLPEQLIQAFLEVDDLSYWVLKTLWNSHWSNKLKEKGVDEEDVYYDKMKLLLSLDREAVRKRIWKLTHKNSSTPSIWLEGIYELKSLVKSKIDTWTKFEPENFYSNNNLSMEENVKINIYNIAHTYSSLLNHRSETVNSYTLFLSNKQQLDFFSEISIWYLLAHSLHDNKNVSPLYELIEEKPYKIISIKTNLEKYNFLVEIIGKKINLDKFYTEETFAHLVLYIKDMTKNCQKEGFFYGFYDLPDLYEVIIEKNNDNKYDSLHREWVVKKDYSHLQYFRKGRHKVIKELIKKQKLSEKQTNEALRQYRSQSYLKNNYDMYGDSFALDFFANSENVEISKPFYCSIPVKNTALRAALYTTMVGGMAWLAHPRTIGTISRGIIGTLILTALKHPDINLLLGSTAAITANILLTIYGDVFLDKFNKASKNIWYMMTFPLLKGPFLYAIVTNDICRLALPFKTFDLKSPGYKLWEKITGKKPTRKVLKISKKITATATLAAFCYFGLCCGFHMFHNLCLKPLALIAPFLEKVSRTFNS